MKREWNKLEARFRRYDNRFMRLKRDKDFSTMRRYANRLLGLRYGYVWNRPWIRIDDRGRIKK